MAATHIKTPAGYMPIRECVIKEMGSKTDREIADKVFEGPFIDPEYFAELCHRGLSGRGMFKEDTYKLINECEKKKLL